MDYSICTIKVCTNFIFCRFDERILLILFGVVTAIVGRAAFFPFPNVDNPAVCVGVPNNCTITANQTLNWSPATHMSNLPSGTDTPLECELD